MSAKGQHNMLWTEFLAVSGTHDLEQLPEVESLF